MSGFPFAGLVEVLPMGVIVVDVRGRVVAVNRPFERLTGHRSADLRERPLLGNLVRGVAGLEESFIEGVTGGRLDMTVDVRPAGGAGPETVGSLRLRSFDHEGRTWVLGLLEAAHSIDVDSLIDRVSTAKHAINNLLMGLMGHAEILTVMDDVPAGARSRGEAILDQSRRLREEVQKLDVPRPGARPKGPVSPAGG